MRCSIRVLATTATALADVPAGATVTPDAAPARPASPSVPSTVVQRGGGASKGLAIAALIVGALGLLAGGAALVTRRRVV